MLNKETDNNAKRKEAREKNGNKNRKVIYSQ